MNAVEIEETVSRLAEAPFDPEAFLFPVAGTRLTRLLTIACKIWESS